jgi:hypothetical protein
MAAIVPLEPAGRELSVQHSPAPQDRQAARQSPQTVLEGVTAQPVAPNAAAIAGLERAVRLKDNQAPHLVDLGLDWPAVGLRDSGLHGTNAVVADKLSEEVGDYPAMVIRSFGCAALGLNPYLALWAFPTACRANVRGFRAAA